MLVSYRWLQEYVDLDAISAQELADKITKSGIEVEGVEVLGEGIQNVVVGHVLECNQHPNADKLNVCQVDVGEGEPVQIICGAPNVGKGQKVVVAKVGAVLPGNFKIKKAKLRGEASHGMICSLQELGVESKLVAKEYAEGIFVFPTDVEVGTDALEHLNLNDEVLELGLTPNRADALSMLGVAYEVAAILGKEVKLPSTAVTETDESTSDYISVNVEAKEDNPYYAARIVKNLKIGPSPLWLQNRLSAAGIRPISNVVDITNFILLEYGQPLHAFDYDRFGSKEVVVRRAREGEKIVTLDDAERTLKSDHLVITNGTEPVALAGVMGGATSEVQNDTTTVLIESAVFNPVTIRKASKDHGLRSEASTRYEKGIDPKRASLAVDRAAQLMADLAGGDVLAGVVVDDNLNLEPVKVTTTLTRINGVLGTEVTGEAVGDIFKRLKFDFEQDGDTFTVYAPTRRQDITIEEDLIEEVARLYGYDNLSSTLPVGRTSAKLTPYQEKRRKTRRYLEGAGLYQAITYSLTNKEKVSQFTALSEGSNPVVLSMPMSEDRSVLRLSLIPHLLDVIAHNGSRQLDDLAVYEISSVFLSNQEQLTDLPKETERLSGALTGKWQFHPWQGEKKPVDFYVAKGVLEGLFSLLGLTDRISFVQGKEDGLHPGRTAHILLDDDQLVGFLGQVHPEKQSELDLNETYVFELALEKLFNAEVEELVYTSIPRFPSMTRDIALVVDETVLAGDIAREIRSAGGNLLKEVSIFDVYQGEHMEKGKKSIAYSLKYLDPERTLTDEEVTKAHEKVLAAVQEKFGATLRG